jgi:hypothetical protein
MIDLEGFNQTSAESYWRVNQPVSEYGQPVVKAHLDLIVIEPTPGPPITKNGTVRFFGKTKIAFLD